MNCAGCGLPLTARQKKYCSKKCGGRHYQRVHAERARAANRQSYAKHRDRRVATAAAKRVTNREALREWMRRWVKNNPDKVKASEARRRDKKVAHMRAYNARPDVKARMRLYREANRQQIANRMQQWCKDNRPRLRGLWNTATHRKRARLAGRENERVDRIKVFSRANWKCQLCGTATPRSLLGTMQPNAPTLDHIVPISKGGAHAYLNLQCACWACNCWKKKDNVQGQPALF